MTEQNWLPSARRCPEFLTYKELAYVEGVSYRTVKRWVQSGRVEIVKTLAGPRIVYVPICPPQTIEPKADTP